MKRRHKSNNQGGNAHASVDADDDDDEDHDDIVWKPKLNKPVDNDEIKTRINDLEFKSDAIVGTSYEMKNVEFLFDLKVCRYWLYELVTNLTNNLE